MGVGSCLLRSLGSPRTLSHRKPTPAKTPASSQSAEKKTQHVAFFCARDTYDACLFFSRRNGCGAPIDGARAAVRTTHALSSSFQSNASCCLVHPSPFFFFFFLVREPVEDRFPTSLRWVAIRRSCARTTVIFVFRIYPVRFYRAFTCA